MAQITSTDVQLSDVRYRLHAAGPVVKEALLFLHGSGPGATGLSNWEATIAELGERYYCLAPDLIGFGDSEHLEDPPVGLKAANLVQARTLWDLLDTLDVSKVHIVGNSMGGMIALEMALMRGDSIGKMLLMGSGGSPNLPSTPGLQHLRTFYADPTPEAMRDLLTSFVYDMSPLEGAVDRIISERMSYVQRSDVQRSHQALFDPSFGPPSFTEAELQSLPHKILCLHGRDDLIVSVESSVYLSRTLPNASLHIIPKCGHWTQIEAQDTFLFLLQALLANDI